MLSFLDAPLDRAIYIAQHVEESTTTDLIAAYAILQRGSWSPYLDKIMQRTLGTYQGLVVMNLKTRMHVGDPIATTWFGQS